MSTDWEHILNRSYIFSSEANSLKKIVKNILVIVLFLAIGLYLFVHISYANRDAFSHTRKNMAGFYAEEDDTIDLVIIGTSSTFSAYMPMKLWEDCGITGYNMCTNLLFEDTMPFMIRELVKTQKPKLLIIDLSPFLRADTAEGAEKYDINPRGNIDGFKYSRNRIDIINTLISDPDKRWPFYFDIIYYHRNGELNLEFWNYCKLNSNKGYNNLAYILKDTQPGKLSRESGQYEFSEYERQKLDILLEETKKYDFDCLFTILPYYESEMNEEVNRRALFIDSYISNEGFKVLNMYNQKEEMNLGDVTDYSSDGLHFHIYSAEKITGFLEKYLEENYSLPDHRGDERYSSWKDSEPEWDSDLEVYREDINRLLDERNQNEQ